MKNPIQTALLTAAILLLPTAVMAQSNEHEAVDQAMKKVIRAFETDDGGLLLNVARKDGMLIGYSIKQGQVVTQSIEEWAKRFNGKLAADEAQRKRSYQILDVSGNAAVVKFMLDYPTWDGVDYLSLLKIDGEWRVVNKAWSGKPKPVVQPGG